MKKTHRRDGKPFPSWTIAVLLSVECALKHYRKNWSLRLLISLVRMTSNLQHCVVHKIQFCLREGREHDILKLYYSSVRIGEFFLYTANGSKNRSGRYKDHSEAKQVKHLWTSRWGKDLPCICWNYYSKLPVIWWFSSRLCIHHIINSTFHILMWLLYQLLWFQCFVTKICFSIAETWNKETLSNLHVNTEFVLKL